MCGWVLLDPLRGGNGVGVSPKQSVYSKKKWVGTGPKFGRGGGVGCIKKLAIVRDSGALSFDFAFSEEKIEKTPIGRLP